MRLTPRGGSDRIDGVADGLLQVRVRAAPVDGAANAALIGLVAEALGVSRSHVVLERGHTSRTKRIAVEGPDAAALLAAWPGLDVHPS